MATVIDLYCGGGGAGVGYWTAGFDVVGVDILPQRHYPFPFMLADALSLEWLSLLDEYEDVIVHASPPCQAFSSATPGFRRGLHMDQVTPIREALWALYLQDRIRGYVIENVPGAPMYRAAVLCGSAFGLGVKRHRLFESMPMFHPPACECSRSVRVKTVAGSYGGPRRDVSAQDGRDAMGIDWLPWPELTQSIPPAYTAFIGTQLGVMLELDLVPRDVEELRPLCECGKPLHRPACGRWPSHCSHACRQRAYRRRNPLAT